MSYIEINETIPETASVDVLVCGGGPAGIGAALVSARQGMNTMIIEAMGALGGVATSGMMSHWGGASSSKIMLELFKRTFETAKNVGWTEGNPESDRCIFHDVQMIALDKMMKEADVRILYYTAVCKAVTENGCIIGVIIQNKSGRSFIRAKRVIDATGDGDVAASAGVPYTKGREDGRMQPATLMFKIGGVDYSRAVFPGSFETLVNTDKGELQALGKSILPFPAGHVLLYRSPTPGTVCINMTNSIGADGTDAESVTRAIIECREQIIPIIEFLKEYAPGYENAWLMSTASLLGIRETRHFEGLDSLTKDDILEAKYHSDWIVRKAFFNFDVHNITGPGLDKTGIQQKWVQSGTYTVPYGCIIPKSIDGLLLSGRNISGSHLAHSSFRIMSVCIALGEAAGAAAALSVKNNISAAKVDPKDIQAIVGE